MLLTILLIIGLIAGGQKMEEKSVQNLSDHQTSEGFFDPYPTWENHGFRDMLKWGFSKKPDIPDEYTFPWVKNDLEFLHQADQQPNFTWIGHATFLIQIHNKTILTDPFFSHRASPVSWAGPERMVPPAIKLQDLPPIDFVVISHNHYDHLDYRTVKYLAERGTQFIVPLKMDHWFERHGMSNVVARDWWGSVTKDGIRFTATPAQHFSARSPFDRNKVLWASWIIQADGITIYFAGDTGYFPGFKQIHKRFPEIDVALLPIGAYNPRWFMKPVHMNPEDAVQAFKDLGAQTGIAMHWGTIKLTDEPMDEPPQRLERSLVENHIDQNRFVVMGFGETRQWKNGNLEVLRGKPDNVVMRTFKLP